MFDPLNGLDLVLSTSHALPHSVPSGALGSRCHHYPHFCFCKNRDKNSYITELHKDWMKEKYLKECHIIGGLEEQVNIRQGICMLPSPAWNSWAQAILPILLSEKLEIEVRTTAFARFPSPSFRTKGDQKFFCS